MSKIENLIDSIAQASVENHPTSDVDEEMRALLEHGKDARIFVSDMRYGSTSERERLHAKLSESPPAFKSAVASVQRIFADEYAADDVRRARVRKENPHLFKD